MMETYKIKNLIENPLRISGLTYEEVKIILTRIKDLLKYDRILLEFSQKSIEKKVCIIGDIHGNLFSLRNILQQIEKYSPELVVFLGDLVDRGPHQLECLLTALLLKFLNPKRYIILKGNHESVEMNKIYGFYQKFIQKFGNDTRFNHLQEIYKLLPYGLVINNKILCLHGGIPKDIDLLNNIKGKSVRDLDSLSKDLNYSLFQVLWNDPKEDINGFQNSYRGPGVFFFGKDVFDVFMKHYQFEYLIRGHEMFQEGYRWFFKNKLLSIFSSENYRGIYNPNFASYAIIKKNHIFPNLI